MTLAVLSCISSNANTYRGTAKEMTCPIFRVYAFIGFQNKFDLARKPNPETKIPKKSAIDLIFPIGFFTF